MDSTHPDEMTSSDKCTQLRSFSIRAANARFLSNALSGSIGCYPEYRIHNIRLSEQLNLE